MESSLPSNIQRLRKNKKHIKDKLNNVSCIIPKNITFNFLIKKLVKGTILMKRAVHCLPQSNTFFYKFIGRVINYTDKMF